MFTPPQTRSYYFWKWADNDLPGRPGEVLAELLRGRWHPALQSFDARALLEQLEMAAAGGQAGGEEWTWEVTPSAEPHRARFVFVTGPDVRYPKERREQFETSFFPLGLSGCDEETDHLIPELLPKLNLFKLGHSLDDPLYDVSLDEVVALVRSLDPGDPNPFAILEDRFSRFVQCKAQGRRFLVEWRENYDPPRCERFNQWRAQDRPRLAALDVPYDKNTPPEKDPDLLLFADTSRIVQAFMRGEPRPERYHWMNINSWLKKR